MERSEYLQRSRALDGGFGWLVVIGSFFINFISSGVMPSFVLPFLDILDEFDEGNRYTSWILSVMWAMPLCAGLIASILLTKFGCRAIAITGSVLAALSFLASFNAGNLLTLIITIGFGVGTGLGLCFVPAIVIVTTYFEKYRTLAVGIALSGAGVGTVVVTPFVDHFNHQYGWRQCMLLFSVVILLCAIFALLFRPLRSTSRNNVQLDDAHRSDAMQYDFRPRIMSSAAAFPLFAFSNFILSLAHSATHLFLADRAIENGVGPDDSRFLLSIIFFSSTVCQIFWGFIADIPRMNRLWIYITCLIVCGIATIASLFCFNHAIWVTYSLLYGVTHGAWLPLRIVILIDLFGPERFNYTFGLLLLFHGIAKIIGEPLFECLFYLLESRMVLTVLSGLMIALGGFILIPLSKKNVPENASGVAMTRIEMHLLPK